MKPELITSLPILFFFSITSLPTAEMETGSLTASAIKQDKLFCSIYSDVFIYGPCSEIISLLLQRNQMHLKDLNTKEGQQLLEHNESPSQIAKTPIEIAEDRIQIKRIIKKKKRAIKKLNKTNN